MQNVFWLILLWLAGWALFPLSHRIWWNLLPDAGLAVGRILALCLWTFTAFWLGSGGVPTRISALLIFPCLLAGAVILWRERDSLLKTVHEKRRSIIAGEALFLAVFLFFFLLRGFGPETVDGEKQMDMAMIAACTRADYLPPPNPYTAGERLVGYYYAGHLQTALLTHAVFSTPQWTYNLMCATVPALVFSALFSLCSALCRSLKWGLLAVCGVLCLGNLSPLRIVWPAVFGQSPGAPEYFSTTRVIPYTINEYPFFTFAFGDLHAHLFAMPLAVLVMCLAWALWRGGQSLPLISCSAALAVLVMTNSWDFPLYTLLAVLAVWGGHKAWRAKLTGVALLILLALGGASLFLLKLKTTSSGVHFIWPSSPPVAWLMIWGVFLAILVPALVRVKKSPESGFCIALVACGLLALVWSEVTWMGYWPPPYHRQDTVFKFGLQAWYFCGTAAFCLALPQVAAGRWPRFVPFLYLPFVAVMLYASGLVVWGRAGEFREFKGTNAWAQLSPYEQEAAQWLQTRAREGDFLIEAEKYDGGDYTAYSRYANSTGVPAVIGPQSHSQQWLGRPGEVLQRKQDVRSFYTTGDEATRLGILRKYQVRWIILGDLERREYGGEWIDYLAQTLSVAARLGTTGEEGSVVICENPAMAAHRP